MSNETPMAPRVFTLKQSFQSPKITDITPPKKSRTSADATGGVYISPSAVQTSTEKRMSLREFVTGASETPTILTTERLNEAGREPHTFEIDCEQCPTTPPSAKKVSEQKKRLSLEAFVPNFGWHWTDKLQRQRPEIPALYTRRL